MSTIQGSPSLSAAQRLTIIGGGMAGLACALAASRRPGLAVELFEASDRFGGLLNTVETPWGLAEEAARAVINQVEWEALCGDVGAELLEADKRSRKRYIYRGRPRQFPLGAGEAVALAQGVGRFLLNRRGLRPAAGETVADWGRRHLGQGAADYLLAPALAGIYAGEIERLSASLILGRFFDPAVKRQPTRIKTRTVTPRAGFVDLISKLEATLRARGVALHLNTRRQLSLDDLDHPCIVATSARQAVPVIRAVAPAAAEQLDGLEMLSLTVVCAWYEHAPGDLQGFGCLFARDQGFRALGVIFNDIIFPRQSQYRSETWIYGGERSPETVDMTDSALQELLHTERRRLTGMAATPKGVHVKRWPKALPYYTPDLEQTMAMMVLPENLHLAGNYVAGIGLSKVVEHSQALVESVLSR